MLRPLARISYLATLYATVFQGMNHGNFGIAFAAGMHRLARRIHHKLCSIPWHGEHLEELEQRQNKRRVSMATITSTQITKLVLVESFKINVPAKRTGAKRQKVADRRDTK